MSKIIELTNFLEQLAPLSSQEDYDNSGLIVGNPETEITNVLVSLDCTEAVVEEAVRKNCNLIVSHHPIVFRALKKFNGKNYVERTIMSAIRNNIALYATHTCLDNSLQGVSAEIAARLSLSNTRILQPKENVLTKLVVFVPTSHAQQLKEALWKAGTGHIGNYDEASFSTAGTGTYRPLEGSQPFEGNLEKRSQVAEERVEFLVSNHLLSQVLKRMWEVHPYEEVAYDLIPLSNSNTTEGAGMIGELKAPMDEHEFLSFVKKTFECEGIRHTELLGKPVQKIAFCGGSGFFLLSDALRQKADVYLTADVKYHEFFDAEKRLLLVDIGHYESEHFTIDLIIRKLKEIFTTFAVLKTEVNTNPIKYF